MAAKKEADIVNEIKKGCEEEAHKIALEKADAEKDLAKAMPFVEEAERAANSIKPNDLNEVKKLGKPSDIIKLVFDLVGLLKMEKMVKTETAEITMGAARGVPSCCGGFTSSIRIVSGRGGRGSFLFC